ncbi:MAG: AAA family ATPase [Thermoproteota archaeon]
MLIQEVILEDFMSYEYARVPFKSGINVVCGPNGSGKSSLLLAISVALGQSYTERSKKLSDLIRWGRDQARVTVILDNSKKDGHRPVPRIDKDQIFLTRGLRRDGKYWFELENRAVTKAKVERVLSKFGVDPDNMLIIMHQSMVGQFTVLSPQEKLKMMEGAVGLQNYRQNVLKAQKDLARISSQESSVNKLLESAEQTLNYWREQYDRYQEKKQLLIKRRFLERELAWAKVEKKEDIVEELETKLKNERKNLEQIQEEIETTTVQFKNRKNKKKELREEWGDLFRHRLNLERERGRKKSTIGTFKDLKEETELLQTVLKRGNPHSLTIQDLEGDLPRQFNLLKTQRLKESIQDFASQIARLEDQIDEEDERMKALEDKREKVNDQILDTRVNLALLKYREERAEEELNEIQRELREAESSLQKVLQEAEGEGARIAVVKSESEVLDAIRVTDGHLSALSDVSEDVERMYESYSNLYQELKEKAKQVAENREETMAEIQARMKAWRRVIKNLLEGVNQKYQKILSQAQATGKVKLLNGHDIEKAGLGIFVGFKGSKPVPLTAYTQSGGERTTATMSFLLALQQHVESPFRAVDEYDVHMDPKNREIISNMLISTVEDTDTQYLVLTPSQVTFAKQGVNLITVQNIEGKSIIREVA